MSGGKFIANTKSDEVHKSNCPWVKLIKKENRKQFNSLETAKKAGYSPHDHSKCLGKKK